MPDSNFEESLKRLEDIVRELESGEMPLEESLRAFEEGMKLLSLCTRRLDEAEKKVTLLVRDKDNGLHEEPFEIDKEPDEGT
jgi:exodeoxyribonuclease VII small subunit